jgi:tetratricopeptide (TPR) repeat protein
MVQIDRILSERSDDRIRSALTAITDSEFSRLSERLLGHLGLRIVRSRTRNGFVIADCIHRPDDTRYVTFFSRRAEVISKEDVESLIAYMDRVEASKAIILTISTISANAVPIAERGSVSMADGAKVTALIRRFDLDRELVRLGEEASRQKSHSETSDVGPETGDAMRSGYEALASRDYLSAMDAFDKAILMDDEYDVAWRLKGNALDELGYHEQALECYKQALERNPDSDETWFSTGSCFFHLSRYEEELTCYDRALQINLENTKVSVNKGSTLHRLGRYREALDVYDGLLRMNYRQEKVHNNRGVSLHKLGRADEALESYTRATELNHGYVEAWINKGNLLFELERYEDALDSFEHVTMIVPALAKGWYLKGLVQQRMGRVTQARSSFEEAMHLDPDHSGASSAIEEISTVMSESYTEIPRITGEIFSDPRRGPRPSPDEPVVTTLSEDVVQRVRGEDIEALADELYGDRAELLLLLGRTDEALEFLEKSLRLEGENARLLTAAGNALYHQGKLEAAIRTFEHAYSADPSFVPALFNLHTTMVEAGEVDTVSKISESLRKNAPGWQGRATAAIEAHRESDFGRALEDIEVALTTANLSMLLNFMGLVRMDAGDFDDAIEAFDKTMSVAFDRSEVHNNLAVALMAKGDLAGARTALDQAIETQKKYHTAWNNRGCVLYKDGRVRESIACFEESLLIHPTSVAMTNMGFGQLSLDRLPEALSAFEESVKISETAEAYNDKGIVLHRMGHCDEALVVFREALRLAPQFNDATKNLKALLAEHPTTDKLAEGEADGSGMRVDGLPSKGSDEDFDAPKLADFDEESLRRMRKTELEAICESLDISSRGTKKELAARIIQAKRPRRRVKSSL